MPAPIVAGLAVARLVAGIVGRGARNVTPVYRNMNTGSIKVLPNSTKGLVIKDNVITNNAKQQTFKNINNFNTEKLKRIKSGEEAAFQNYAALPLQGVLRTKKVIKINSGNTRAR